MVSRGDKTAADAARLFRIHPATVCRLLARPPAPPTRKAKHANVDGITPNNSESDTPGKTNWHTFRLSASLAYEVLEGRLRRYRAGV